jgi:hypothetical protein
LKGNDEQQMVQSALNSQSVSIQAITLATTCLTSSCLSHVGANA